MTLIIKKPTGAKLALKNYNAPAAIAGVAPTLDYRFALDRRELDAVSLTDKLTVTRAATAAVNGPTGYLELAGPNVARFDHSPTTNQSLGLLVEESRTNLIRYSENISANNTTFGVAFALDTATSPSGTITADSLIEDSSNGRHDYFTNSPPLLAAATHVFSIYVKPKGRTWVKVRFDVAGLFNGVYFHLSGDGSIGTSSAGYTGSIQKVANGWYRCSVSYTTVAADYYPTVRLASADGVDSYQGDGTSGVYVWGAQLETGSTATTYIPTTSSTVTRTESASINGTGVITGTYTMVEKPSGCAVVNGTNIDIQPGYTAERVMVFPAALSSEKITAIRSVM